MNQDRIKDRILRRAAIMWGYNELEAETSFDPVVSLLLSACASELEKLDFELESSRARIIERVLEVMFPEETSGAVPASTLVQVEPLENNATISFYNTFKTPIRKQNIYNPTETIIKDIYFSPTIEAQLTTAKVKYIAYDATLNHIESFFFEDSVAKAQRNLPSGELWLGLHSANKENLRDLMLFIDINNNYQKEIFFYYLKQAKVYFKGKEYPLKQGYNVENPGINIENIITNNYSNIDYTYSDTNRFYEGNFYTLLGDFEFSEKEDKEELFEHYFPNHKIAEEDDIIWLKFKFSEAIIPDILQNVRVALNCIPMLNVRNKNLGRKLKDRLNIIPIHEDDHFLDLDYVSDDRNGKRLDIKSYDAENEGMTAILRRGGISRFDSRDASELLQYLLELIKDETAAFAGMGINSINETLKQINQNVAALHQVAKEKNFIQANNPYLIISAGNEREEIKCSISYWSTAAEEANNLKPATVLVEDKAGNAVLKPNAVMIKTSVGGRKKLSSHDKILEYRNSLLTRGRIVTIADIKALGMNHFKNTIIDIEVKKGTKKEVSLKGGFSRTIDVFLIRDKENIDNMTDAEWSYLCDSFSLKLTNSSANIYPYRLFEK